MWPSAWVWQQVTCVTSANHVTHIDTHSCNTTPPHSQRTKKRQNWINSKHDTHMSCSVSIVSVSERTPMPISSEIFSTIFTSNVLLSPWLTPSTVWHDILLGPWIVLMIVRWCAGLISPLPGKVEPDKHTIPESFIVFQLGIGSSIVLLDVVTYDWCNRV